MSSHKQIDHGSKSSRQIARDADQSRARIEDMLDQIEARLSPGELMDQVQAYLRSGPGEFGSNLGAIIKSNPVPVALAGIGLSWLALASSRNQPRPERGGPERGGNGFGTGRMTDEDDLERSPYPDLGPRPAGVVSVYPDGAASRAEDDPGNGSGLAARADAAGESAQRLAQNVGRRIGDAGGQARHQAGRAQDAAGRAARQARDGFLRILTEQPLVVASIGVALGALLGTALPSTAREDEVMGEASDGLKREAQAFGREQMETAQKAVAEKVDEVAAPPGSTTPHVSERNS